MNYQEKQCKTSIKEHIDTLMNLLFDEEAMNNIQAISSMITEALNRGNRVFFAGNGGSAADAQHLAAELSGRYMFDRPPLAAEALHCNTSFVTAVANDYGYDMIYERAVEGQCREGDILVVISTSGNSSNLLRACNKAKEKGVRTIGLLGRDGGEIARNTEISVTVKSETTPRIQEAHIMIGHIICGIVENDIFPQIAQ